MAAAGHGNHERVLPLCNISPPAAQADSFIDFSNSLISFSHLADNNTISIFTKIGLSVHKEQDVLITCQGKPILIGVHNEYGCYHVPLVKHKGQWHPHPPQIKSMPYCTKPIASTTCPLSSKGFTGCTQFAVIPSNPHGWRQSRPVTFLVGHYSMRQSSQNTFPTQLKATVGI